MASIVSAMAESVVFDADNHLYETRDAFTRYLPGRYKGAIDYVEVRGRTKIVIRGQIGDHPQPDLRRGGPTGRHGGVLPGGQPRGRTAGRCSVSRWALDVPGA